MRAVLARGLIVTVVLGLALTGRAAAAGEEYANHVLTSNDTAVIPADNADPHLINPWGLVSSATSPWWTANNGTDTSTLYNTLGVPFPATPLVVAVPRPTGIVFNGTGTAFPTTGGASNFIFDSEDGNLYGWRSGSAATQKATKAGAIYKGLAIATPPGGTPQLYAADFHNGTVDIYDQTWALVSSAKFADPSLPAGYAPFGIQTIGNRIFVAYAKQDDDAEDEVAGAGLGYVDVFDTAGTLLARVGGGGTLNAPWGLAMAPASFGAFGGDLLVGNFGDGRIDAFKETSPGTWTPDGTLRGVDNNPLVIDGLWALEFGAGGTNNGPTSTLFYTAGPNDETEGVLGRITANPLVAVTAPLGVGGTVASQLSLSLGPAAAFGSFTPGVAGDYTATSPATVTSTAGDAALSVVDPSTNHPGHLVNGAFFLPQAVQASAASAGGTSAPAASVGASPLTLLNYAGPVSNDAVTLTFKQAIAATDGLRTGSYSKTFTFTLSTTNP